MLAVPAAAPVPKVQTLTVLCKAEASSYGPNGSRGGWSVILDPRARTVTLTTGSPNAKEVARAEPAGGVVDPSCHRIAAPKPHHEFVLTSPWPATLFSRVFCNTVQTNGIVVQLTKARGKPTRMVVSVGGSPVVIATIGRRSGGIAMAGDECGRSGV